VKRLAAAALLAVALAACGGAADPPRADPAPAETGLTKTQIAAKKLLAALDEHGCDCTGEARAKQRIEDGKAVKRG
jgi:hypothetical protein